jgi:hypothetical protein
MVWWENKMMEGKRFAEPLRILPLNLYGKSNNEFNDSFYIKRFNPEVCLDTWVNVVPEASYGDLDGNVFLSEKIFNTYDIMIIPPWCRLDKKIKFDLVINTRSMMEMNNQTIKNYFSIIQRHIKIKGIFLNINRYLKRTKNNKTKISNFPYDENWEVIKSEKSWMQDWVHMLITRRNTKKNNIKKELNILKLYSVKYELMQFFHVLKNKIKNKFNC